MWGFIMAPFWQGRHPAVLFWRSIAGCHSMIAFTYLCAGNSTPNDFSSRTLARGIMIRYCVSRFAVCKNPPMAMLAIFKARRMTDCSSWTRPPCLAIVEDMLKTYKNWIAAANNEIRRWPQPYMLPYAPLRWLKADASTHRDAYQEILP